MDETGAITLVRLGSYGEAETESPKMKGLTEDHEPQELVTVRMDRNLQVRLLQVDGDHPVSLTDGHDN